MLRNSCWCFDAFIGASALLLVLQHSCCVGNNVLIGAPALMLVLRHSCCVGNHVLIGAPALLLVLQHSCCVGKHVLICVPALLLVLRHSCCVGRHVLYGATAPQYYIVPSGTYCAGSYSFLMIGPGSQNSYMIRLRIKNKSKDLNVPLYLFCSTYGYSYF